MGNKVTKPQLIIGCAAIVTIGGIIYQKKQYENKQKSLASSVSSQQKQNEEQTKELVVGNIKQQDTAQNAQQVDNQSKMNLVEDSSNIDSVQFINRVNKELRAYQEEQQPLSFEVLIRITEAGFKLVAEPYSQNQRKNRTQRRNLFNNSQEYVRCVLEFNYELETLINEKQLNICSKLRISSEIYENSFMLQFQNQADLERFIVFQFSLRQNLIASIPSQKQISQQELVQVTNLQLQKLDDIQFFQKYLKELKGEDQQLASVIITVLLSDIVFEQFGFEEEDVLKAVLAYPLLKNQLGQIQEKVQNVLETCFQ